MRKFLILCVLGLATSAACRSDSNTLVDAPKGVDAPGADAIPVTTVKAIRMNQPTNGQLVSLQNVVVTAHVTSSKYGHVWVQDQGGGMYSGIQIFCNYGGTTPSCMSTKAQIDALAIGTVISVTGKFSSFLLNTAPAGAQPVLEIESPVISAPNGTMPVVAIDVAASVVAKGQLAAAGAEPYKGALVHVTGASTFTTSSVTAAEFSTTCSDKSTPPQMGTTYGGFEVTGASQTLAIGLNFYNTVTYCLPCNGVAMPYPCTNQVKTAPATTFTSVTGIVEPQYNCGGTTCPGTNPSVFLELSPTTDTDLP